VRGARIKTAFLSTAPRVTRNAASLDFLRSVFWLIPVRSPFPNISDHIDKPITICGKYMDRRGSFIAIAAQILPREIALPRVSHVLPTIIELLTPCVGSTIEASACGKLPLYFGRQVFSRPFRVSLRIAQYAIWTTGCIASPSSELVGSNGCRQSAPCMKCHQLQTFEFSRSFGLTNTADPAWSISGSASG
jgi:hypothetical protein